jgi:Flp pilus assembly protein TadB
VTAASVLVAALVIVTVLLSRPPRPALTHDPAPVLVRPEQAALRRLRVPLTAVAGLGGWAMVGGQVGVAVGGVCAAAVWVVLGRGESPEVVRRRAQLRQDLPLGVDLLGACLEAGAAPVGALEAVGRAVGGPVGEEFLVLHHRLAIGVDPAQAWEAVARHPQLGPLGRAVARAHDSGASVGRAVHQLSEELREGLQAEVEARARSIEVKAAAPLGVCLLPAFVLLGVVPLVAGVFGSMQLFG